MVAVSRTYYRYCQDICPFVDGIPTEKLFAMLQVWGLMSAALPMTLVPFAVTVMLARAPLSMAAAARHLTKLHKVRLSLTPFAA